MNWNELNAQQAVEQALALDPSSCITCSFQAEDMAVLHMAIRVKPDVPVLFLETGYHFPETYAYRDRYADLWRLNVINLMPDTTVPEQEATHGLLYKTNPTACCNHRKVGPLFKGLAGYKVWLTGLRREQSPTRANLARRETHTLPDGRQLWKISPVADWTNRDVWQYLKQQDIEPLPLYQQGYTSIGCAPCTVLPLDPNDPRSGRWAGAGKLECGIHTFSEQK